MKPETQEEIRGRLSIVVQLLNDESERNRGAYLFEAFLHLLHALILVLKDGDEACKEIAVFPGLEEVITSLARHYSMESDIVLKLAKLKR